MNKYQSVSWTPLAKSIAILIGLLMSISCTSAARADILGAETAPITMTSFAATYSFTAHGGTVNCLSVNFKGTQKTLPTRTFTLAPSFSSCTFVGLVSKFETNGCEFLFHIYEGTSTFGSTDLVCPAGKEMTVTSPSVGTPKCILHIPPSSGMVGLNYWNWGSGTTREIEVSGSLISTTYSQTKGTAETGNCATDDGVFGNSSNFSFFLTGEKDGGSEHVGMVLSG